MFKTNQLFFFITTLLFVFNVNASDLPFDIVPDGALPTTVPEDGTVGATYTVTNNTRYDRTNNFVKYLPENVVNALTGTCGTTFNLPAFASCTLELTISGPVDPNQGGASNRLFVCMSDGTTCAGTNYPLNVTQTSPIPPGTNTGLGVAAGITQGITLNGEMVGGVPFLVSSNDEGVNWTNQQDAIPGSVTAGSINSTSCTGPSSTAICVGVGGNKTSTPTLPFVITSTDGANTWNTISSGSLPATTGFLYGVSCTGTPGIYVLCAAVGQSTTNAPTIWQSRNGTT